jgi:MFS family permease
LEAGVRFLPTTLVIIVVAPIAGRLSDRIGPRPLIVSGLLIVAASLFLQSTIDESSTYSTLLVPFILMGLGIALTMSPMSTAAMNAVAETKAGLASGLLSMFRMVGGTFGIAVLGAIFQAASSSKLDSALSGTGVTSATRDAIGEQLGSGQLAGTLEKLPPDQAQAAADAARSAFIDSLSGSIRISAAVAAAGAVLAVWLISAKRSGGDEKAVTASPELAGAADAQPATPELAGSASSR